MKLAVISDIHGNLPALTAVIDHVERWQPDQVIVNGDIVNRGPNSLGCWRLIQSKQAAGWRVLKGNHEDYLLGHMGQTAPGVDIQSQINHLSWWTYQQMGGEIAGIGQLPDGCQIVAPDESLALVYHASTHHNRDSFFPNAANEVVLQKITSLNGEPPPLFLTAHRPLQPRPARASAASHVIRIKSTLHDSRISAEKLRARARQGILKPTGDGKPRAW